MGDVAVSLKIMPESPDTDLEKIKEDISKKIEIKDSKIEPLAFGLKALKILIIIPDEGMKNIENEIRSIDGISEVEIESSTVV
ncbi:MAG: elongation factor 1-beta [Candidatus Aenigmarchaeota archaeon]|nr:elongation factor 1-beta [Candidatus Aenigmarchaeota archaeon]